MKPKFYDEGGAVSAEGLRAVADFLNGDLLAGQTCLVAELLRHGGCGEGVSFCWDDVANSYAVPEHVRVVESFDDDGNTVFQLEFGELIQSFHETEADAREAALDYEEPLEIYEWWLVSSWLADKLYRAGAPVLRNGFGTWWGRTTTGQSPYIDDVLVSLAAHHGVIDAGYGEGAA